MNAIHKACAALVLAAASPAFAQTNDPAMIDQAYDSRVMACLDANRDNETITPQSRQAACEANLVETNAYYATRVTPGQHEMNVYYFHRGFLQLEIGGAFLKQDTRRSARVCQQTELAWLDLSLIVDSASPDAYQANYVSMRGGIAGAVKVCRSEFGTPAGAPPLPPS